MFRSCAQTSATNLFVRDENSFLFLAKKLLHARILLFLLRIMLMLMLMVDDDVDDNSFLK